MNKEISKLNKCYKESVERYQCLREEQLELREKAKSYQNCNDIPKELQVDIFEHRILLNHYIKHIKNINKKLRKLEHWQTEETLKKHESE